MGSTDFELQRQNTTAIVGWAVQVNFYNSYGAKQNTRWWATTPMVLEDGFTYLGLLAKNSLRGRHQRGRGNDYAEFAVGNKTHALSSALEIYEDFMEKSDVTIYHCYVVAEGKGGVIWNSEQMFFGYIKTYTVDDSDRTIKFSCVSDMSRSNFMVGGRILTRERCGTDFNFGGTLPASESICGWQTSQGGPSLSCSKIYNDATNGCLAHANQHRFFAVPGLSTAVVNINSGGGGGWDDPDPYCFAESAYVLMANREVCPIYKIEKGDRHMGFDIRNHDWLIEGDVLNTFKNPSKEIWTARFDQATLEVKKEHKFYLGNYQFVPVGYLGTRPAVGINSQFKAATSDLLSIERSIEQLWVYNLHTSTSNYIVTDKDKNFFYFVHNRKDDPIIQ